MRAKLWAQARALYSELLSEGGWVSDPSKVTNETSLLTMRACIAMVVREARG